MIILQRSEGLPDKKLACSASIHRVITLISTASAAAAAPGCEGLTQQGLSSGGSCHCMIQTTTVMERRADHTKLQPQDSPSAVSAHACAPSPSSPLQSQSPAGPAKGREETTSIKVRKEVYEPLLISAALLWDYTSPTKHPNSPQDGKRAVFGCALMVTTALGCHPMVQHGSSPITTYGS